MQTIREVMHHEAAFEFPLKWCYDAARRTMPGLEDGFGELYEGSDCADDEGPPLEDADTWEVFDDGILRNHVSPRTCFFDPSGSADLPCPLARLGPKRITNIRPVDIPGAVFLVEHLDWRDDGVRVSDAGRGPWLGMSFFPYVSWRTFLKRLSRRVNLGGTRSTQPRSTPVNRGGCLNTGAGPVLWLDRPDRPTSPRRFGAGRALA